MEAQSTLLGLHFTISIPFIRNSRTPLYLSPALNHPKSISFSTSDGVSFKTHYSIGSNFQVTQKACKGRASVEDVMSETASSVLEDDLRAKTKRKSLDVFVSGGGSNFKSLHEAAVNGFVHGDINVLVTNKPDYGGAEYARDKGIPIIFSPKAKDGSGLSPTDLVNVLRSYDVDSTLLAGFLELIPTELIQAFPRSILNIHPSLLPAFGGKGYYSMKVHKAVIASGARVSGPTIHFVDEEYDRWCILAQRIVPVLTNDTAEELAGSVLREEHKLYKDVVAALCEHNSYGGKMVNCIGNGT